MVEVKKPCFPFNVGLMIFRKVMKSDKVGMINPFTLSIYAYPAPYELSEKTYAHETRHIEQAKERGRLAFIVKYLWYSMRYGYTNNPYEVDARAYAEELYGT